MSEILQFNREEIWAHNMEPRKYYVAYDDDTEADVTESHAANVVLVGVGDIRPRTRLFTVFEGFLKNLLNANYLRLDIQSHEKVYKIP